MLGTNFSMLNRKLCHLQNWNEKQKQSPDGHTIVSAAADETLRFWKILGTNENKLKPGRGKIVEAATFGMKRMSIR